MVSSGSPLEPTRGITASCAIKLIGNSLTQRGLLPKIIFRNSPCKCTTFVHKIVFICSFASRGLPLGAKGSLYSACVYSTVLHGNETCPVKKEDVIKLMRNDTRMVRWIGISLRIGFLLRNFGLD